MAGIFGPVFLLPAGAGLALAFFIPVLCLISVWMKQTRVVRRRRATWHTDTLKTIKYFQLYEKNPLRGLVSQTWFPILVILLFNLYFTYLLLWTPQLNAHDYGNILVLGHFFMAQNPGNDSNIRQSFVVMGFAYLGWYVWTVANVFSRLITMELVAATFYNILVRLVVAVFVALMFNYLQSSLFSGNSYGPEAMGFGVGLFPDAALAFLTATLRKWLLRTDSRLETLELDLIQGISPFRKLRLYEMGLDNCENLAAANAMELFLKSNLKLVEVADWIGQGQLVLLVGKERFITLQRNGYRTVIDLHRGAHSPALTDLARLLKFSSPQVRDLAIGLEQDPSFQNLVELRSHLRDPAS